MSQGEQTLNRPRFAKVDSWGWCDVGRDHDLAFSEVMLLLAITIHADFRSRIWTGTITELHETTRMARKTISKYLERLITKGLIVEVQKAHGSRPGRIDVSRHYDELIVPNQREQRAAAKQKAAADESALETDCVSSASSLSQMARPTRENADLGGVEAIEEEKVQDARSDANGLRGFYKAAVERWNGTKIQELLDAAIKDHGLEPDGCWWLDADAVGISGRLKERLDSIAAGFEEF